MKELTLDAALEGPFSVRFTPTGGRLSYYTLVNNRYLPVESVDAFLRFKRHGQGRAELTTRTYAGQLKLFADWCADRDISIEKGVGQFSHFVAWLRITPIARVGRGHGNLRTQATCRGILIAVGELVTWATELGYADDQLLKKLKREETSPQLYGTQYRARTHIHRAPGDSNELTKWATQDEYWAMVKAVNSERDRFLLIVMYELGLRIDGALGLHISDMHLSKTPPKGCDYRHGHHIHLIQRENKENSARAKAPEGSNYRLPVEEDSVTEQYHIMRAERDKALERAGKESSYVFVNIRGGIIGEAMLYNNAYKMFKAAAKNAGITRDLSPHSFRHSFGYNHRSEERPIVMRLMGHKSEASTDRYSDVDEKQMREAVDRVPSPLNPQLKKKKP